MGWVGSGCGDFLTQPTMVGKKKIQPNPTHMGRVGSVWTYVFDKFSLLLLYWVEKIYKY